MKEFVVNTHKVCTVECDIPVDVCPVAQMLLERGTKQVDAEPCSVYDIPAVGRTCIRIQTRDVRKLNNIIMEMCLNCNVQER